MAIDIRRRPPMQEPNELKLGADGSMLLDGGYSLKYDPTQIADNQSPAMLNMLAIDNGAILNKRDGQKDVYAASLGAGGFNGALGRLFFGNKLVAWGAGIYSQQGTAAPVLLKAVTNAKGSFFPFGGKVYFLNGTDFVVIDSALSAVDVVPYVPTLLISTTPGGKGTPFEAANLLTPSFKMSYSSDGVATKYYFPLTGLDAAVVTLTINGAAKVEGTHFTVNRAAVPFAYVDFAAGTAPTGVIATGAANNVIVTAAKTVAGSAAKIKGCRYLIDYGGDNDTRLFAWGNPAFPNRVQRSGLLDGTYWPDQEYSDVGSSSEAVTAVAKHYDKLVYLKERSIAFTSYSNPVTQGFWGASQIGASFPLLWINSAIGCDMPDSVQIIDNNIVFGNSQLGLFIIVSTTVKDERNVHPISGNVNGAPSRPGLLALPKADLQAASSVDMDGRYWLCVGAQVFVWDYRLSPYAGDEDQLKWFPLDSINAACWIQDGAELFYGHRTAGRLVTFQDNYNDFGGAINGRWRSKRFAFNLPNWLKNVKKAWFTAKAGGFSAITIKYFSERGETIDQETININTFGWDVAAWDIWTWAITEYPPPARLEPRFRKVVYFQIEFSNNNLNENLSLMSLVIQFSPVKKVK